MSDRNTIKIESSKSASLDTRQMIGLIDELVTLAAEENALLSNGMPASLSKITKRKGEIADIFELWVRESSSCRGRANAASLDERELFERIQTLKEVMVENIARLGSAIEATRRRIEAVMCAIREDISVKAPYGATGAARRLDASCQLAIRI